MKKSNLLGARYRIPAPADGPGDRAAKQNQMAIASNVAKLNVFSPQGGARISWKASAI